MKYLVVGLLVMGCAISSTIQAQEDDLSSYCSTETSETNILADHTLFFTMPSLEEDPQLELWQAQADDISFTGLSFSPLTIFQSNPTGDSIIAVITQADYYLPEDTLYEYSGSEISDIILIDTEHLTTTSVNIPEEFENIRFLRRIQWIDDDRILLLSPDWYYAFLLNVITSELEIIDLGEFDPPPYVIYPGGTMVPSPSGDYLLYTTVDPSLPLVGVAPNQEQAFAWRVLELQGDFSLEYVTGIGGSARWLTDDTIALRTHDNGFVGVNIFDGEAVQIYQPSSNILLTHMLPSADASLIAFTRWLEMQESDDFQQYSLVILNTEDAVAYDTCLSWIDLEKEAWSLDSKLLAYVTRTVDTTNLYVLNINSNEYIQILPRQPLNASIGDRFIRNVGWK